MPSTYHRPFAEQLEFFRQKTNLPTERWDDIVHEAHDRSFIVAGAQGADLLADLNAAVLKSIEQGTGLNAFRKDFDALVAKNGWTGWTGEGSKQGVAWRTKVIYQTNLATSYAAGRYQQLTDPELKTVLPYWQYKHADSVLFPRPLHVSWNGLTLPPEHPFWQAHFPPNGWGCHCRIRAVSKREYLKAIARGKGPANAPAADDLEGIDPGFAYTPGKSVADELRGLVQKKAETLPRPIGEALVKEAQTLADPAALAQAIDTAAARIAGESVEHLLLFTPAGVPLLEKAGAADHVALASDELALLPGQVLLHNHPGLPQSFSRYDVELALWHNLEEMHVVDRLYHYRMARPAGESWSPAAWQRLRPLWERVEAEVIERLERALASGLIRQDERDALRDHMICEEVNSMVPIGYARRRRDGHE